jgi:hypothetical protein
MNENPSASEPSAFAETTATMRETAGDVRHALEEGHTPGQWKAILSDLVREAPLPSLAVAFLLGVIVARR